MTINQPSRAPLPVDPESPRGRLHHAIRRQFSSTIATFYKANPQFLDDERGRKGVSAMLGMMHEILNEIDKYEIVSRKEEEI